VLVLLLYHQKKEFVGLVFMKQNEKTLKLKNPSSKAYEALTPKQKEFFDLYTQTRTIASVVSKTGWNSGDTLKVYQSVGVQAALAEHNENLKTTSQYNEGIIIDKLWFEYADPDTPKNIKVQILVQLGKHIGMWANSTGTSKEVGTKSVTYNIVNYSGIKNVASKAWYDTYTNIYTASTVTAFLNASYSKEMLQKRINDSDFFVAEDEDTDDEPDVSIGIAGAPAGAGSGSSAIYKLLGVVEHSGQTAESGHYTATVRNSNDCRFYRCNDSQIGDATDHLRGSGVYLLFYMREKGECIRWGGMMESRTTATATRRLGGGSTVQEWHQPVKDSDGFTIVVDKKKKKKVPYYSG
jgi:hypothetical protein